MILNKLRANYQINGFTSIKNYKNVYVNEKLEIKYSDGDIENEIFDIINDCPTDSSCNFNYLEKFIKCWPTEYHFSWVRQNIVKPVKFNSYDVVLELGGGTGVITDYLVTKAKTVISIEGTLLRGKTISKRCSKFNNLDVLIGNFLEMDLINLFGKSSFEKIFLIGVLEYIPKYGSKKNHDSISELLKVCRKLLKPEGEIIIAIENKLGLKYLLGREEDHFGKRHYGTQSLYKKDDITTFSKKELNDILKKEGFSQLDFFYPFPDYKLPEVIIKEDSGLLNNKIKSLLKDLTYNLNTRNYSGRDSEKLYEGRILNNFIDENNIGLISNSFLIVGKNNYSKDNVTFPFAYRFSTTRNFKYSNEMFFYNKNNEIIINKKWNGEKTENNPLNLNNVGDLNLNYIEGKLLKNLLNDFFLIDDRRTYISLLNKWIQLLILEFDKASCSFDLLPHNVLVRNNFEVFEFFDTNEWVTSHKLTLNQIIERFVETAFDEMQWLYGENKENSYYVRSILCECNVKDSKQKEEISLTELNHYMKNEILSKNYYSKNISKVTLKVKKAKSLSVLNFKLRIKRIINSVHSRM